MNLLLTHTPANQSPVMSFMTHQLTREGPPRAKPAGVPSVVHYLFEGGPSDTEDDVSDSGLTAGSKWFSKKNSTARQAHVAQPGVQAAYTPRYDR